MIKATYFDISNCSAIYSATEASSRCSLCNGVHPYGSLFDESASTEFVKATARATGSEIADNPYRYSGKEWLSFRGLNLYDFSARQYDPTTARFTSPDPFNGSYPHLSPYLYCAANPINLSDPSGLAVIYDYNGDFLGNTSEGFTGQIYITDSTNKIDFTTYTESQLLDSESLVINSYDDVGIGLTIDAQTAILNNIISHFNGSYIYFEKFEMSKIDGGGIIFLEAAKKNSFNWRTILQYRGTKVVGKPVIYGNGNFLNDYEATVENIASSVIVHEWYSHGVMHCLDENKTHRFAYENVINWKPLWNSTTNRYKGFIMNRLKYYTIQETNQNMVDYIYRNLFEEFINYYTNGK